MDLEQLIKEVVALRRPCMYLTADPHAGPFAGWWQTALPEVGAIQPWLTVDASLVPDAGLTGFLVLAEDTDNCGAQVTTTQRPVESGLRLYAQPGYSPPPVDAIFRFGSHRVGEWLAQLGWKRDAPYNGNFRGRELIEQVERKFWWDTHPFYNKGMAYAVLGGWHFPWPDGDWSERLDSRMLVWTFANSEPWLEAWLRQGVLEAKHRTT